MGKSSKKKKQSAESGEDRFDASKPEFRRSAKDVKSSKVVLDERFACVLTDPRFQLDIKDKYGRKSKSKKAKEDLSEFYTIDDGVTGNEKEKRQSSANKHNDGDDGDDGDGPQKPRANETSTDSDRSLSSSSSSLEGSESSKGGKQTKKSEKSQVKDEVEDKDPASRIAYLTALSRGEIDISSSSSENEESDVEVDAPSAGGGGDDDDDDTDTSEDAVLGKAGVLDPSTYDDEHVELTTEESPYLAVQNMDWSNVRAVDIFTILSSFTPPGAVKRVQVFPSDFGTVRLAKEAMFGPVDVWKKKKKTIQPAGGTGTDHDSDEDNEDAKIAPYESDDDHTESANDVKFSERDGDPYVPDESGKTDFDPEKLRAYEASRLKYFFAVVEFSKAEHADIAYKAVDGMEFEHSSAAIDLRSIPVEALGEVVRNRELRDEATNIPSNYVPPDFVVNALQQSNVQCTWDMGDRDRESTLTKYDAGQVWGELAGGDDLKAYIASDNSSDEESVEENAKASGLRKLLGLDSDDERDNVKADLATNSPLEDDSSSDSETDDENNDGEATKEATFIPGQLGISSNKIGSNQEQKVDGKGELTPWEKYQEKRKQKRREKRHAAREKRKEVNEARKGKSQRKKSSFQESEESLVDESERSDRFLTRHPKEELELLVAGADSEEEARDFDMRGLKRLEKNKEKKLRGARKRKEEELAASVSGTEFKFDTTDDRFKAVLDGSDDRFGIDRTDPFYKETSAMREILAEQTRRRKKKRKTDSAETEVTPDASAESATASAGSAALSTLVRSIKAKLSR